MDEQDLVTSFTPVGCYI